MPPNDRVGALAATARTVPPVTTENAGRRGLGQLRHFVSLRGWGAGAMSSESAACIAYASLLLPSCACVSAKRPSRVPPGSQPIPSSSSPGGMPREPASLTSVSTRATRSPRSSCPTAVQCREARTASSSWESLARLRQWELGRLPRGRCSRTRPHLCLAEGSRD